MPNISWGTHDEDLDIAGRQCNDLHQLREMIGAMISKLENITMKLEAHEVAHDLGEGLTQRTIVDDQAGQSMGYYFRKNPARPATL